MEGAVTGDLHRQDVPLRYACRLMAFVQTRVICRFCVDSSSLTLQHHEATALSDVTPNLLIEKHVLLARATETQVHIIDLLQVSSSRTRCVSGKVGWRKLGCTCNFCSRYFMAKSTR